MNDIRNMLIFLFMLAIVTPLFSQTLHPGCDAKPGSYYKDVEGTQLVYVTRVKTDTVFYHYYHDKIWDMAMTLSHPDFHRKWKLWATPDNSSFPGEDYKWGDLWQKKSDARIKVVIWGTKTMEDGTLAVLFKRDYQWPDGPMRQLMETIFIRQYKKIGKYSPN